MGQSSSSSSGSGSGSSSRRRSVATALGLGQTPVSGGGSEVTSACTCGVEGSAETTVGNVPCARLTTDQRINPGC